MLVTRTTCQFVAAESAVWPGRTQTESLLITCSAAVDVSAQEHAQERRGGRFDSPRGESRGGGGFAFGTDDRDFSRDRSKDRRGGERRRY